MPTVTDLIHLLGLDYLVNPHKRLYWGYLLSTLLIVISYFAISRQSVSSVFSRQLWWHPSARLDYSYFLVVSLIKISLILPWILSMREVAFAVLNLMQSIFGYPQFGTIMWQQQWILLAYTLSLFVVSDFSRYWLHRLMHSIPFLWEFHKVHHSAEVLTPFTFYRVHPVENLLFGLRYALSSGLVTGVFVYFFAANLGLLQIAGVNLFVFVGHVLGDNLRHSPVHLRYPNWLERVLISPAQHQLHHCIDGSRRNYGGVLAVWDSLFGSLRHSNVYDVYRFGLADNYEFKTLYSLLLSPFTHCYQRLPGKPVYEQNT